MVLSNRSCSCRVRVVEFDKSASVCYSFLIFSGSIQKRVRTHPHTYLEQGQIRDAELVENEFDFQEQIIRSKFGSPSVCAHIIVSYTAGERCGVRPCTS